MKKWVFITILVFSIFSYTSAIFSILGLYISPEKYYFFAFFSLTYLLILPLTWISGLFILFNNKKIGIVALIFSFLYSFYLPRFYQVSLYKSDTKTENTIKIMSYNVRLFDLYNWKENIKNRNLIFKFLEKENPHIMCFQEFYHQEDSEKFPTKDTLLKFMEWKFYHERYTHEMRNNQYFGVATFSNFPIICKGEIAFDNDENNFCIFTDIIIQKDTIRVYNGHIGSIRFKKEDYEYFGEETNMIPASDEGTKIIPRLKEAFISRASQIDKISISIKNSPHPVVLCIDMNDTPMSYAYQQIQNQLKDAFRVSGEGSGTTYIGKVPSFRIDYIFHSENIQSSGFRTHKEKLSDHRAISCEIWIP